MIRIVANAVLFRVSGLFGQVRNRGSEEPFLKRIKLITDCRSLLKFEITGIGRHLLLQLLHALRDRLFVREIRRTSFLMPFGTIWCSSLNAICFARRRFVSVMAAFMESVI